MFGSNIAHLVKLRADAELKRACTIRVYFSQPALVALDLFYCSLYELSCSAGEEILKCLAGEKQNDGLQ
jgi:hypothetical protein